MTDVLKFCGYIIVHLIDSLQCLKSFLQDLLALCESLYILQHSFGICCSVLDQLIELISELLQLCKLLINAGPCVRSLHRVVEEGVMQSLFIPGISSTKCLRHLLQRFFRRGSGNTILEALY